MYKKIIIIGAARSGTNMLRDVLTKKQNIATWPCDEINYIWRYGNKRVPHDEFNVNHISNKNKKYINNQFDKLYRKTKADYIVEKTCANSLRVNFIEGVLDKPLYINIMRDPIDVVASAKKRWKAELDIPYILKKAKYVPIGDLPYYGIKYLKNRIAKLKNEDGTLSYWGPQLRDMDQILDKSTTEEICAYQWEKAVRKSIAAFDKVPENRIVNVYYQDFVNNPQKELKRIFDFYEIEYTNDEIIELVKGVHPKSVKKGYQQLSEEQISIIKEIVSETYKKAYNHEEI